MVKNLPANAGDSGLVPGSGRSGRYSRLGNPMARGTWRAIQSMGLHRVRHN